MRTASRSATGTYTAAMLTALLRRRRALALLALIIGLLAMSSVSALASSGKQVKVADNFFGPKTLTVGKGTKVTWKWVGVLNHNVVVHTGPSNFSSRTQARGSYSHVFTKRGTYALVCTIHKSMKMTVVVR
jgi:plastocyanin